MDEAYTRPVWAIPNSPSGMYVIDLSTPSRNPPNGAERAAIHQFLRAERLEAELAQYKSQNR